jgi:hypothetical protein
MSATLMPATIGSGWDAIAGPDAPLARHLAEWIAGSAVAPELAAANVQSIAGPEVLEALASDRLEQLGGHSSQYVTAAAARLLRQLEPLATAGGWWCSGLDPLADWAPMAWGCFKPDQPRWDAERNRARKYEHPLGAAARLFWLRVPAAIAARVADRFGLSLPAAVGADAYGSAGAFWRWWAQTRALPLLLTEGSKKAAALLSLGIPAIAAPGIWNPAPKGTDSRPTLLPELAAQPLKGRPVWVLYDHSDDPKGRRDVAKAYRRVGRLLAAAGADVRVGACPGPHKGADDALAAGVPWETLAASLQPLTPPPALAQLRPARLAAPAGSHLSATATDAMRGRRLLATNAPMGSGKTIWARDGVAPYLACGVPVIAPTHRTALGESQSEALGIPWAAMPGTDGRLQGLGLCWDSLRPSSALAIRPTDWMGPDGLGPVVVLDEIAQGIEHVLFGTGTAVAEHRPQTMATTAELLRIARLLLAMDAQLSEPVLRLLEALAGESAYLIGSEHRPMAGRPVLVPQGLTARTAAEQGRARILQLAKEGRRVFVVTTAQQAHAKGSARGLARLVKRHNTDARILTIDSEAPDAAELLGSDPNGTAAAHDWIICSPSITSGLSIDAPGLFDEVVVIGAGGQLPCEALVQAAARVRDPACPVRIYAPATTPQLRIGSGDTNPAALLDHLARCEARLLADLIGAAGWDPAATNESPWLRCWLELAAYRNRQAAAYSCSVAAMLEAEAWAVSTDAPRPPVELQQQAAAELGEIAQEAQAVADAAVIEALPLTDQEARQLARKRRRTPEERAQLDRHHIDRRWGLQGRPPTPELLEADREGLNGRLRFGWILQRQEGRQLAATHDRIRARQLAPDGTGWAPDLVRELLGHRIAAADALGLPAWLERGQTGEWFSADDPALLQLHATATACRGDTIATLGIGPSARPSGTLRAVLRLIGYRLEARRNRCGNGRRGWSYRAVPEALPAGVDEADLEAAWHLQLVNPS